MAPVAFRAEVHQKASGLVGRGPEAPRGKTQFVSVPPFVSVPQIVMARVTAMRSSATRTSKPKGFYSSESASFFGARRRQPSRSNSAISVHGGFLSSQAPIQPLGPTYGGLK